MDGLSHVFLHLGLCSAIAKLPAEATVPIHVRMAFRTGDAQFDRTFKIARGDGREAVLEFDVGRGVYRVLVDAPRQHCSANDFLDFLPEGNRKVVETLVDGAPVAPTPVTLLDGTAPVSFLYVKPTLVLLDPSIACDKPVVATVPSRVNVEYDQGSYHAWLYDDGAANTGPYTVALRLKTPTNTAHYVRLPFAFPTPWSGFPTHIQFNVSEEMIDGIATDKIETLLCPKLWETRSR